MQKDWTAIFKVKVTLTVMVQILKKRLCSNSNTEPLNSLLASVLVYHNSFDWVSCKKIGWLSSRSMSHLGFKSSKMTVWYLLNYMYVFNMFSSSQTWHAGQSLPGKLTREESGLLSTRSRLQVLQPQECIHVHYNHIFWTAEPFATRLGMLVHH